MHLRGGLLASLCAAVCATCDFTVSCGRSLFDAQADVRSRIRVGNLSLSQPHVICLPPGRYDVSSNPLTFTEDDSVTTHVIWRGTGPRGSAIVSGGVQVASWAPASEYGAGVFSARVPSGFSPGAVVRQLWVAGERANRTSTDASTAFGTAAPWESADKTHAGFTVDRVPPAWKINKYGS